LENILEKYINNPGCVCVVGNVETTTTSESQSLLLKAINQEYLFLHFLSDFACVWHYISKPAAKNLEYFAHISRFGKCCLKK